MTAASSLQFAQRLRLRRTLYAAAGGIVLSLVGWIALDYGILRLSPTAFGVTSALFWLGNICIIATIRSGANLRLGDPSMTLFQTFWATFWIFLFIYFLDAHRHVLLMIYLLVMIFGAFRLRLREFLSITLAAVSAYALIIVALTRFEPGAVDVHAELSTLFVFAVVMLAFSLLGAEANQMRQTIGKRNRELIAARNLARAENEAKNRFLATVSHELRTPLHSVLAVSDILRDAQLKPEEQHFLRMARAAGEQLMTLVESMLDLSRLDQQRLTLEPEDFDLHQTIQQIVRSMSVNAEEHGLALNARIESGVPVQVHGDGKRLREILVHLLSNAIKFTPSGTVHVTVRTDSISPDQVLISVADTGIGIAEQDQQGVFEPFSQVDSSITRQRGGAGLGLTLCQRLTSLMGGTIWLDSTNGQGSTFHIAVPLAESAHPNASLSDADGDTQLGLVLGPDADQPRILSVDDSEDNRLLVRRFLNRSPVEVIEAANGAEALELFRTQHFDLVLMDVHMPVMDGLQATREIRRLEKDLNQVPTLIAALTADALSIDKQQYVDAGCNAYLSKPISRDELLSFIRSQLAVTIDGEHI